jgi:hypothetical protein
LGLCKSVSNSATKLRVLEVVSEATTDDVNGTLTIIWSNERGDIIDDALSVVVEVSEALLDTFQFDCESNGSEIILTESTVALSVLLGVQTSSSFILIVYHWALDQVVVNRKWSHFYIVKDT